MPRIRSKVAPSRPPCDCLACRPGAEDGSAGGVEADPTAASTSPMDYGTRAARQEPPPKCLVRKRGKGRGRPAAHSLQPGSSSRDALSIHIRSSALSLLNNNLNRFLSLRELSTTWQRSRPQTLPHQGPVRRRVPTAPTLTSTSSPAAAPPPSWCPERRPPREPTRRYLPRTRARSPSVRCWATGTTGSRTGERGGAAEGKIC
jgi:hypothetical protein